MPTNPTSPAETKKNDKKLTVGDFVAIFIFVAGMACAVLGLNYFAYTEFVSIKDEFWLNSHGTLARDPSLYVIQHGHPPPELCANYFTQQDKLYSKCIPLWFPLVLINQDSPQIIHYNPASPEHISTSWGRQILFSRTCSSLLILILALLIDLAIFLAMTGKLGG